MIGLVRLHQRNFCFGEEKIAITLIRRSLAGGLLAVAGVVVLISRYPVCGGRGAMPGGVAPPGRQPSQGHKLNDCIEKSMLAFYMLSSGSTVRPLRPGRRG